jgi:hypothetical protein
VWPERVVFQPPFFNQHLGLLQGIENLTVATGIEYCLLNVNSTPEIASGRIHALRIDSSKAKLKLLLASEHGKNPRTAAGWCKDFGMVATINAGMYGKDLLTNVGYLRSGTYVQNKRWNKSYKSVLAFDPQKPDRPPAIMVDLDEPDAIRKVEDYDVVIQNLRLIKGNGVNVWGRSDRKWSEVAVGMDISGNILFLFCRAPYSMKEFNEIIKSSGLGIVRLMHMEGGPVASMSIRSKNVSLDLAGSYETEINPNDENKIQWPIPNVIGVQIK